MSFNLRVSSFAICWLRAYDFGMEQKQLEASLDKLKAGDWIDGIFRLSNPNEIDEVDRRMFDVRFQDRSNLVRIHFRPIHFVSQPLNHDKCLNDPLLVNLMLDLASGFGVINVSFSQLGQIGSLSYSTEEIGFLTRQWLLAEDDTGKPVRLNVCLPGSNGTCNFYIREIMNYYYIYIHRLLWEGVEGESVYNHGGPDLLQACSEKSPRGCEWIHTLLENGLVRSLYPTSFGPFLDIWGIQGIDAKSFDADMFTKKYWSEISYLFTDGTRTILGEDLYNERRTKLLALYVWPNHALYINQHPNAILPNRVLERVGEYGYLDIEVVRIFEILTLQSALLRAYDRQLDQQLEEFAKISVGDQKAFIKVAQKRRDISRSMRSFDFFNLFHTAYWEPLYARLLANHHLGYEAAKNLIELKSARLDEEIQNALLIQDRARQEQQRDQELDVLRGLHNLSLVNDTQSRALGRINFIVSATASFAFTQVLAPLLTKAYGASPSFQEVFPELWILLNVAVFALVALILYSSSLLLIQLRSRMVEIEGREEFEYNPEQLMSYIAKCKDIKHYHISTDDWSGYLRIEKKNFSLILEFDEKHFHRYILFLQTWRKQDLVAMKKKTVDEEIKKVKAACMASKG